MIEVQGKQIATSKILIKDLFADDMWYNIPDYQRPYVWGEEQISTLLDDISYAAVQTPDSQYFLGSVVLHCQRQEKDGTSYIENAVLDGQQRLTTLYLLHAVIRDLTDKKKRRDSCANVIFQEGDTDYEIPERLRLEFSIREEVADFIDKFVKEFKGTGKEEELKLLSEISKNVSVKNMARAIMIIRKWFTTDNLSIDTLFPYLCTKVIMVYVASKELEDAFRLFTVLNDRGIKLRNSDILKALNLKEVDGKTERETWAKFWEQLEGELEEDFDQFLSYVRTILVKDKARNNLLKEFEDNIYNPTVFNQSTKLREKRPPLLNKGKQTFEVIEKYKSHYDKIFDFNNYNNSNNWAYDNLVKVLQDTALSDIWIPPLMTYREYFGDYRIFDFLLKLDNKFSGDWIARETPTKRIEAMNWIIKEIEKVSKNSDSKDENIDSLLNSTVFVFNNKEFFRQIEEGKVYGRRFARYILRKIDFLLDAPYYAERRNSYSTMSVEHVLPQTPKDDSQWLKDFHQEEHEEWVHRMGNLILISKRKNTSQGRLDFDLKKKKYFTNSIETFPHSLQVMQKQKWGVDELKRHHQNLIELLKNHYSN